MEKMIKSMEINKENEYFPDFASDRAEIFDILAHKTNEKLCKIDEKSEKSQLNIFIVDLTSERPKFFRSIGKLENLRGKVKYFARSLSKSQN